MSGKMVWTHIMFLFSCVCVSFEGKNASSIYNTRARKQRLVSVERWKCQTNKQIMLNPFFRISLTVVRVCRSIINLNTTWQTYEDWFCCFKQRLMCVCAFFPVHFAHFWWFHTMTMTMSVLIFERNIGKIRRCTYRIINTVHILHRSLVFTVLHFTNKSSCLHTEFHLPMLVHNFKL